jgi:hydroxymethylglutaryl-CoA lyase
MMPKEVGSAGGVEATGEAPSTFRWVECPRDAWQALPVRIASEAKRSHLQALLDAGFRNLDLGSFVSPGAVPQMADTEEVLRRLERPDDADFIGIIANTKGLERACANGRATSVGYPLSLSETFQARNSGMSVADSWRLVERIWREARRCDLELVVYLSMGFGNPYGDRWRPSHTGEAVSRLRELGVSRIALADTAGAAVPELVTEVIESAGRPEQLGVHLHARPDNWRGVLGAAWNAGARWFEGALAGIGGCPFAGDELVGNLPSEQVLPWLAARAGGSPVPLEPLPELAGRAVEIARLGRAHPHPPA